MANIVTQKKRMKMRSLIISVALTLVNASCYYRNHVPLSSLNDPNPKVVEMKVGEKRKIRSKTIFTEISPGLLMGPAYYLRSSNPKIVVIDSHVVEDIAYIKAVAPGEARIEYTDQEGVIIPIRVMPNGGQDVTE